MKRARKDRSVSTSPPAPVTPLLSTPERLSGLLTRLERWLAEHRPRYLEALLPGATPGQLDALRAAVCCPVPDELAVLLSWHNGQDLQAFVALEESWLFLGTEEIADRKRELDESFPEGWPVTGLPIFDNDNNSYLFLDTCQPVPPVHALWYGRSETPLVAPSLTDWFAGFVEGVEKGHYYEEPERGGFHRRS